MQSRIVVSILLGLVVTMILTCPAAPVHAREGKSHGKVRGAVIWYNPPPGPVLWGLAYFSAHNSARGKVGDRGRWHFDSMGTFTGSYDMKVGCVNIDHVNRSAWIAGQVKAGTGDFADDVGKWVVWSVHDGGTPGRNRDRISATGFHSSRASACNLVHQRIGRAQFDVVAGNLLIR